MRRRRDARQIKVPKSCASLLDIVRRCSISFAAARRLRCCSLSFAASRHLTRRLAAALLMTSIVLVYPMGASLSEANAECR